MFENINLGKNGFKTCVFEKICISCSCIWLISFNAWRILCKNWAFFQNCDFSRISIDWDCFSINQNWFKKFFFLVSLYLFQSIETDFRLIKNCESSFLKTEFDLFNLTFQKFFKLFSLSSIWTRLILNFLLFSSDLFARFSSLQAGKSIIPFLLHLFSCCHAFFHAFCWDFWTYSFWDFCWFKPNILKLIIGFCSYNVINLILLNFEKLKFLGLVCIQIMDFVQLGPNW